MTNDFKLYIGLSPYWRRAKDAGELNKQYYRPCIEMCKSVLFTYYNLNDFLNWMTFMGSGVTGINVMMDCGAFSIWREGEKSVDVDKYIDFALKLQQEQLFKSLVFISLDKIPGTVKRAASPEEVDEAAETSLWNYKRMREAGVENLLPVYHLGEDISCLEKMVDAGADYVGIGGLARGATAGARRALMERVFNCLKQYPKVKAHGFGVTASKLVLDYLWYSVDSVTPFLEPGYGNVSFFDRKARKMTRKNVSEIVNRGSRLSEGDKRILEKRFEVPFEDLKTLWCRRYFSVKEWLKFERFVKHERKTETKKVFQQSLLGAIK